MDFGLPLTIRTANGVPFANRSAFFGLSKLSVWWLRLGIGTERMHLTLKKEATKPAAINLLKHQAKFDQFIDYYNQERHTRRWKADARLSSIGPRRAHTRA